MQLIDNWQAVLTKSWSSRFGLAAGLFTVLNALTELGLVLPYLDGVLPKKTLLVLSILCAVAGYASRFIKQPTLHQAPEGESA